MIAADPLRRELAAHLRGRGHDVTVVQGWTAAARVDADGVDWRFVRLAPLPRRVAHALGDPHPLLRVPAVEVLPAVVVSRPEVVHAFDLVAFPTLALLPRPLVVTFHGGAPARRLAWRLAQRVGLRGATLAFTSLEQGRGFGRPIVAIPETSTTMRRVPAPRLPGSPALLWVGRLDPVKDPWTVLRGVRRLRVRHPDVHLTMVWTDAPLLDDVRAWVAAELAGAVTLLGPRPPEALPALYSGADRLVQGSVREVCGRALLEAMACGLPPVVPSLPATRAIVPDVRLLFPVGDDAAMAAAVEVEPAVDVAAHFEAELAFGPLTTRYERLYAELRAR